MALEVATYISDLVTTNPVGATDLKSTLDDHIRLIKSTVKTTFPNVSGAVTPTHTQLNYVTGVTSAIQTQIDLKAPLASPALTGTPTVPTAADGTATTQAASTAYVVTRVAAAAMSATTPVVASDANKYWSNNGTTASWTPHKVMREARTSNTVLGAVDSGKFFDLTSGTFSQTFAAAATLGAGWYCYIRNAGTGDITLDPDGSEQIDGLTSFVMYPGEARFVQCDGSALRSVVLSPFFRTFTASGTFTKPPGYSAFGVIAWSGGSSGQRNNNAAAVSVGGAGGGCFSVVFSYASVGTTEAVTIGAGGAAVTTVANGNVGGNTTLGSLLTVYGGTSFSDGGAIGYTAAITTSGAANAVGFEAAPSNNSPFNAVYGGATAGNTAAANSGSSIYGGGAGAGIDGAGNVRTAGTSKFGGNGGAASIASNGTAGSAPAGGGGATQTGTASGAGARGELRIWGLA